MTDEPWQWPESRWRSAVEQVRAGRKITPPSWPGGARVAVAVSFDSDHETTALRSGDTHPGRLSQGEYGSRVGAPRILDLLEKHGVPASFFVPAVTALLHPEEVSNYAAAGHEVALHGWIHEWNTEIPGETERDLLHRSADVLERLSGETPVGIRTPSWDFSEHTLEIIAELGLTYDSSLMADDEPFEILNRGAQTGIVEIPVEWIRDDAPYLSMDRRSGVRPWPAPRDLIRPWTDEFEAAYQAGGLFQLTMHPHVIGHRSRLVVLAELLEYVGSHADVWFATHRQVAEVCAPQIRAGE
ncbi:MAG: polysaccharide deacetylase [Acidimicrobiaceae bacterium]|nr:polysaccharide deacetylase [Acidimicrobiaceae bacterium]